MLFRQISRGSPERIYACVRNCSGTTLDVGMAPVFEYHLGGSTGNTVGSYQDGYNVTIRTATNAPGLLAGIVATHGIEPGEFGICQCFGHVDSMILATSGLNSTNPLTGMNTASMDDKQLFPAATVTNHVRAGALYYVAASSWTSIEELQARVWLGSWFENGDTTNTHGTGHTTVMVKGFIKAM